MPRPTRISRKMMTTAYSTLRHIGAELCNSRADEPSLAAKAHQSPAELVAHLPKSLQTFLLGTPGARGIGHGPVQPLRASQEGRADLFGAQRDDDVNRPAVDRVDRLRALLADVDADLLEHA